MIAPRLIVPLTLAVLAIGATGALGQTPFPAPLPNSAAGTANDPAFPPVRGSVGTPNDPAYPPVNGTPAQRTAAPQNSPFRWGVWGGGGRSSRRARPVAQSA